MKNFTMIMMVAMLSVGSVFAQTITFKVGVWESADAFESHIYGAVVLLEEVDNPINVHSVTIEYNDTFGGPFPLLYDVPYGNYNVTVSADGYQSYTTELTVDGGVGNDNVFYLDAIVQTITFKVGVWSSPDAFESHIYGAVVLIEEVGNSSNAHSVTIEYNDTFGGPFPLLYDVPYGNYNVTVSADGYQAYTTELTVDGDVGNDIVFYLGEIPLATESVTTTAISVYPNPTTGLVNISKEVEKVEVYDVSGSLVKVVNGPALTGFDISDLSNGLYVLKVTDSNNESTLMKINKK